MIQLKPGEKFIIARQIDDPTDSATYYIRAYIRNATTDELIATVDLEDKGDQRFRGSFYVPQDNSGQGTYITITTKVFDDAGYTTENALNRRTEETYLVQQRWSMMLGGGGGGSVVRIDYKKIQGLIDEAIKGIKIPQAKNITNREITKLDTESLVGEIERIIVKEKTKIPEYPKQNEIDLRPIINGLNGLRVMIGMIKIPETDLSKIYGEFKNINLIIKDLINKTEISKEDMKKHIEENSPRFDLFEEPKQVKKKKIFV